MSAGQFSVRQGKGEGGRRVPSACEGLLCPPWAREEARRCSGAGRTSEVVQEETLCGGWGGPRASSRARACGQTLGTTGAHPSCLILRPGVGRSSRPSPPAEGRSARVSVAGLLELPCSPHAIQAASLSLPVPQCPLTAGKDSALASDTLPGLVWPVPCCPRRTPAGSRSAEWSSCSSEAGPAELTPGVLAEPLLTFPGQDTPVTSSPR